MIKFINNIGDYFSSNYFDEDFPKKVLSKTGYAVDDVKGFQKKISSTKDKYFKYKQLILEGRLRVKDKVTETHNFHSTMLKALGYDSEQTEYENLFHLDEKTVLPIRHKLYRGEQLHLMIMEMQPLIKESEEEPDGLFEQSYHIEEANNSTPPQKYHRSQWSNIFTVPDGLKISPIVINKAVSQLFLLDAHRRPKYILLCAGNTFYLLEQEKWFKGSYLEMNIEMLFDEASIKRDYYSLFYFLLSKETLAPQSEIVLMDQLDEDSHKSAFAVTQDLKEGVIHAVESIANETVSQLAEQGDLMMVDGKWQFTKDDLAAIDIAATLKEECLSYVYRLLFLFYAEAREDLDILPSNDDNYTHGYSLEMLRDLEQVPLNSASSQNGYFFHESLSKLFHLLSSGYREREQVNKSFRIRHLDSPLFDDSSLKILPLVKLRNIIWQDIICRLSLSKKKKGKARGRISYANLGINQLGSVYESLLAFRGFFAESDHIEVHRKKKKANETSESIANKDGSYLVPRTRLDEFDIKERYYEADDTLRIIKEGTFIYRLSGRDRQKSASYYTPEVLTQCTVKYTLKPILEKLDKGEIKALDLLELKILEPAMGAAAFHNEVINQLSEAYIQYRQKELNQKVAPDKYREEIQKVKAYIAMNNVYGVDLNPTAIELGKLSLWLNVIHKDMQTPFFGYRLGTGNAVVGAWLKAYDTKDILLNPNNKREKKEWWTKAPTHLKFHKTNHNLLRGKNQIYHFLLPDKAMVASAGIKLLKDEYKNESDHVRSWKSEFMKPISQNELPILEKICDGIDTLLEQHYEHQRRVNQLTIGKLTMFGIETPELNLQTYDEKEKLAAVRYQHNAPYFKLKMIMDYWCSLWFWDMREAKQLPSRQEWYQDLQYIINFENEIVNLTSQANKTNLYENLRLKYVKEYGQLYKFFHYQLEFIEVFKERNGFDIIVGNPPWMRIELKPEEFLGEFDPVIIIKDYEIAKIDSLLPQYMNEESIKNEYLSQLITTTSSNKFFNSTSIYQLTGKQANLYKLVLENSFNSINEHGHLGLLHPESIYDETGGDEMRKEAYLRLNYHFQFQNQLFLFSEVGHRFKFSVNIYSSRKKSISFFSINNLFNVSTVDLCFQHDGTGEIFGIKKYEKKGLVWNTKGHKGRIVKYTEDTLQQLGLIFEGNVKKAPKLPTIHAQGIITPILKFNSIELKIDGLEYEISTCWGETSSQRDGTIKRVTKFPDIQNYELIYSGPHFYNCNPLYKTPRAKCTEKSHYDVVVHAEIEEDFLPRTNYIPNVTIEEYIERKSENLEWFNSYKVAWSRRINQAAERSLQPAIIPPKVGHVHTVISGIFSEDMVVLIAGITSSLPLDFYLKSTGKADLYENTIKTFPLTSNSKKVIHISARTLLLNCVSNNYSRLWSTQYKEEFKSLSWCKLDNRLRSFSTLSQNWQKSTPLRNWYERRHALMEIDVITAMALGLTLDELILIYNVQFPVFQENEDDTWYDINGNIIFSCSRGITGIGVDRPVWNTIRDLKAGETFEHTIEKSELYFGKKVTYHAPFDKCDRVEDYKVAWEHFEKIFKEEK